MRAGAAAAGFFANSFNELASCTGMTGQKGQKSIR
jgi:hypothetical protein